MKHELSELLRTAADGPAPRYTAEDAVAAGRKRQWRRRAFWSGAGSAAVVVAVAGAITLPRAMAERPPHPSVPAATASATIAAFGYPAEPFTGNIPAYRAGSLVVSGTSLVTPTYQSAPVSGGPDVTGSLVVYRAGAFDAGQVRAGTQVSVGGRTGHLVSGPSESTIAWEYAADAWVVVSIRGATPAGRQDLRAVAAGFRLGPPQPMRVPFKLGYVPPGYTLGATGVPGMRTGQTFVRLHKGGNTFTITMSPAGRGSAEDISPTPSCVPGGACHRSTGDRKWVAELTGLLPPAESAKVLERLDVADPANRDTWYEATEAVR